MLENVRSANSTSVSEVTSEAVRTALELVCESEEFVASPRLIQFLRYIVDETLDGRGEQIKGKTIAVDVYGRTLDESGSAQNLVRVEARRLRRLLNEVYSHQAENIEIRIHVDSGGYTPRFVTNGTPPVALIEDHSESSSEVRISKRTLMGLGVAAMLSIAALAFWIPQREAPTPPVEVDERAVREALRARSIPALQAVNLAQQARVLLFPVFDVKRQKMALEMFRHSIELDPAIADGYAGAAQALATLSILSPDEGDARRIATEADEMADAALVHAPTDAWATGAKGAALAANGEWAAAERAAQRAIELAPRDGHVLDLVGYVAVLSGASELAVRAADPDRDRIGPGRFAAPNIWGVAQLMLGNDAAVVDAFDEAPAAGAPVSAPSLIFPAVALDRLGNETEARKLVDELGTSFPEFPARLIIRRFFAEDKQTGQDILDTLEKYEFLQPEN